MSSTDPPFKSVSIIGLGLIGGSIALAVRERWPATRISGVDRKGVLAHAMGSGAIDRAGRQRRRRRRRRPDHPCRAGAPEPEAACRNRAARPAHRHRHRRREHEARHRGRGSRAGLFVVRWRASDRRGGAGRLRIRQTRSRSTTGHGSSRRRRRRRRRLSIGCSSLRAASVRSRRAWMRPSTTA